MENPPPEVADFASQAVEYVRRALGIVLEYDSDTLPLLDHYLTTVPADEPATVALVAATSGAYFGEVVRRRLGGRWEGTAGEVSEWRVILPTGVQFSPAGFVAAAIRKADLEDFVTILEAPPRLRTYLADALARMGEVTDEEYYSLCGRLDTLEHIHEVLVAVAAKLMGGPPDDEDEPEVEPEPTPIN